MNCKLRRPNILDIEASGFGAHSYPIEVGFVKTDGERFSRLIKPLHDWTHWSEEAESVHHISRQTLFKHGCEPRQVALELNELLVGQTMYSDGWTVDKPWLDKLFYSSAVPMRFFLSPLESILSIQQMECWKKAMKSARDSLQVARHRASTDALVIQETFVRSMQ